MFFYHRICHVNFTIITISIVSLFLGYLCFDQQLILKEQTPFAHHIFQNLVAWTFVVWMWLRCLKLHNIPHNPWTISGRYDSPLLWWPSGYYRMLQFAAFLHHQQHNTILSTKEWAFTFVVIISNIWLNYPFSLMSWRTDATNSAVLSLPLADIFSTCNVFNRLYV